MAPNIANIPDYWLWLGLGVFTFVAVKQVSIGLANIRSLTEIRNAPPTHDASISRLHTNSTHQEDAIKTSSLLTLATSPNIEIRHASTKILCQRFSASPSLRRLLLRDLNSDDDETKHKAQLAFNMLCEFGAFGSADVQPTTPSDGWRLHDTSGRAAAAAMDVDEAEVRRRRREAVVIHEGERPVGQEDVYMRDQDGERMGHDEMVQARAESFVV